MHANASEADWITLPRSEVGIGQCKRNGFGKVSFGSNSNDDCD